MKLMFIPLICVETTAALAAAFGYSEVCLWEGTCWQLSASNRYRGPRYEAKFRFAKELMLDMQFDVVDFIQHQFNRAYKKMLQELEPEQLVSYAARTHEVDRAHR